MVTGVPGPRDVDIAGLILAGGEGRRMGGIDKGLVLWRGQPLAVYVYQALASVVSPVIISANRSLEYYRTLGSRAIADDEEYRWHGPLAGLLSGLEEAQRLGCSAVLSAPCDTPELTAEIGERLCRAYLDQPGRPVVAECEGRVHPLHGVFPVELVPELRRRLSTGERRVVGFVRDMAALPVNCDDTPSAFVNRNTPEDVREG